MKAVILLFLVFLIFPLPVQAGEDGRKTPYLGYSWPFEGRDLDAEMGGRPVLLELFSDQGCMYCPPADLFFNDLVRKTHVTALAYHVALQRREEVDPLATKDGYDRQVFYSVVMRETRTTPRMVINGYVFVDGYMYQNVLDAIIKSDTSPDFLFLDIRPGKKRNSYDVHLPAVQLKGIIKGFDDHVTLRLAEYLKPSLSPVGEGPNDGFNPEYLHVVSRIIDLGPWTGEERDYSFTWKPSANAAGAVFLLDREDKGLTGFGEIKLP